MTRGPTDLAGGEAAYDLHVHSLCSDGTYEPRAVASLAAGAGLAGFALTDHDTTAGWDEAASACAELGLGFVPGIELSAETGGRSVHLLGYWIDGSHPGLLAECDRLRGERDRRARAIVARLAELGVLLSEERVRAIAGDAPIGRPHIAAAMVEAGVVEDSVEAFDRYLADGGPAWEPKHALEPADAVALLRDAGGVAVLAHPGCTELPGGLFEHLVEAGLGGVECEHPGHEPDMVARWRHEADRHGLVPTGASDFHGSRKDVKIGEHATGVARLDELRSRRAEPSPASGQREDNPW